MGMGTRRMIEVEYRSLNQTVYQDFNATLLNSTAAIVNATLVNGTIKAPNYLFASLIASNATGDSNLGSNGSSSSGDPTGSDAPPSNSRSSLAM